MAKTPEQIEELLEKMSGTIDGLAARVDALETEVKEVDASLSHNPDQAALSPSHVFSPSQKGLSEYEEARTKILRQKPTEKIDLVHMGKKISVDYQQGRILLKQAGLI